MSKRNIIVPQAQEALDRFKYEIASETGLPIKNNAGSEMTSYQYGYMIKKMIEAQQKQMTDDSPREKQ